MPVDEAALRQANELYAADYQQRLAADLAAMLPTTANRPSAC